MHLTPSIRLLLVALFLPLASCNLNDQPAPIVDGETTFSLPPGFVINKFFTGLLRPRFMAIGPGGITLVAEADAGRIIALPDADADGVADDLLEIVTGLEFPTSLTYQNGFLYIAETHQITRHVLSDDLVVSDSVILIPDLPNQPAAGLQGAGHTTRTVVIGSDDRIYVSVGSSCNSCAESDPRRAAVSVYELDGGDGRVFATGLRNAVGLAVEPTTGELWASCNGRDGYGEWLPPEMIYILRDGKDYGWPRCHAGFLPEIEPFAGADACDGVEQPVATLDAHMAPLGITFYTENQFPSEYHGNLFVALHGSKNRLFHEGYKIMMIPVLDGVVSGPPEDFATGWLRSDGTAAGRPAGVLVASDGSLLVSDDALGTIYRISYVGD